MKSSWESRPGSPDAQVQKVKLAPMEDSEAAEGLPNLNGRRQADFQQPSADAERPMRDALMDCYNGWPEQPER